MAMWFILVIIVAMPAFMAAATERGSLPGILGNDDRTPLDTEDWPWTAIGRVNRSVGGFCTGALIGPRHVLTAAHCLYDRRTGRRIRPSDIHFLPGYRRGAYLAHSAARDLIVPDEYRFDAALRGDTPAVDWAILVLESPMPVRPLPIRAESMPAGTPLILAGYGQDRAHLLSIHDGCAAMPGLGRPGLILHTCDATRGDSGSPLLMREAGGPVIVGVAVGVGKVAADMVGIAVPAVTFLDRTRAALAAR